MQRKELSLFSGAGGGLLATKLLGWKTVGYVEFDDYCQRIIKERIIDGYLSPAPIFGDIRAFILQGFAAAYQGMVDVVTAGFPCQPFSVAGKQMGADDPRNMWPQTVDVIRIVRPSSVFLENVPAIISSGYIIQVIDDLRGAGYQVLPPLRLSASDLGANHKRERIWIVAHLPTHVPDTDDRQRIRPQQTIRPGRDSAELSSQTPADTGGPEQGRRQQPERRQNQRDTDPARNGTQGRTGIMADAECEPQRPGLRSGRSYGQRRGRSGDSSGTPSTGAGWWETEPGMGRVVDGLAYRVDRLKALGNGQVPIVAATAWRILNDVV